MSSSTGNTLIGHNSSDIRRHYQRRIRVGEVIILARKTYVSLITPRRTIARVQATTKTRVDLKLRLEGEKLVGRMQPSRTREIMRSQISLTAPGDVDSEVLDWLEKAYDQNR